LNDTYILEGPTPDGHAGYLEARPRELVPECIVCDGSPQAKAVRTLDRLFAQYQCPIRISAADIHDRL
jgi:hypothetical protein